MEKQSIVGFIVFYAPQDNYHSFVILFCGSVVPYISNRAHQHLKVWLVNVKGMNQVSPIIPKHADLYNNIYIRIQTSTQLLAQGMKINRLPKPHTDQRLECNLQHH